MFSAYLFYYVSGRCHELPPTSRSVDVKLVGSKGEGKSVLHFDLSQKEYKEVFLYVPSYLRFQSAVHYCRVTDAALMCSRHEKCEERTEVVFKDRESLKGKVTHKHRTFSKLKSHFRQLVCSKTTSHHVFTSNEDCVLRVQEIPAGSMLTIDINFLLELKPTYDGNASCIPVSFGWSKKMVFCYSLEYVSSYPIDAVNVDEESVAAVKWRIHGAERNFASLFFNSEQESLGKLEFTIDYIPKLSPSLLVTSSSSLEHCNGSYIRDYHVVLDHLFISEHDPRVAHLKFPSEFIFLVDCSGSMCGASIQSAADALVLFIKSLPISCYFNVVAFGSTYRNLFEDSQKYSKETVERAMAFAHKLQASLGGTELLNPLHWILKKPLVGDMPRQIFILTDGAVTNTKAVLREIQKYSHQIRCHTFGIGSEACQELVLGVAALSSGRHALVSTKDRLQEKVIKALEESLKPALTDVAIMWRPPAHYDIVETLCGHRGAVFNGGSVSYWGRVVDNGSETVNTDDSEASAMVSAVVGSTHKFEQTICNICEVDKSGICGAYSITERLLGWSKIQELERSLSISRRRSQDEHSLTEDADKSTQTNCVSQQLTQLSTQHHIPCCLNYLSNKDSSFLSVSQVIPEVYSQQKPLPTSTRPSHHSRHKHYYRQRNGSTKYHMSDTPSFLPTSNSLGTMFKGAVSSVSNSLKSLISVGLDSVFGGYQDLVEDGQRIEDEIDTQSSAEMLQWGPEGQLIHPSIYFQSTSELLDGTCNNNMNGDTVRKRKLDYVPNVAKSLKLDDSFAEDPLPNSSMACMSLTDTCQNDTQDYGRCQMDFTQQPITGPAAMMPLINMQAFDGVWHLSEPFSAAIGIPHKQVEDFIHSQTGPTKCTSTLNCNGNGDLPSDHEPFWATALAIACLQFHFVVYKTEWKLLVEKAIGCLDNANITSSSHAVERSRNFITQISVA